MRLYQRVYTFYFHNYIHNTIEVIQNDLSVLRFTSTSPIIIIDDPSILLFILTYIVVNHHLIKSR